MPLAGGRPYRVCTRGPEARVAAWIETERLLAAGLFPPSDTWFGSSSWEAAFHTRCFPACLLAVVQRGSMHKGADLW